LNTEKAKTLFEKIYKPFVLNGHPIIFTDISSAEMIKYAANSMLATRISFMNDIANLCEIVGLILIWYAKELAVTVVLGANSFTPESDMEDLVFQKM
jgi:UDPglucose 6-dehydrogenase